MRVLKNKQAVESVYKSTFGLFLVLGLMAGCGQEYSNQKASNSGSQQSPTPHAASALDVIACDEASGITPICGFVNPEDLAVVPGGEMLLVSEMGIFMQDTPNTLSLLNISSNAREPLAVNWQLQGATWGDPNCGAPKIDRFSPHGIDLITRPDGRHSLLVVNHGDERIEFFELTGEGTDWRLN